MFVVFILSCSDASYHVGITKDLNERIEYYHSKKNNSPVKLRPAFDVVFQAQFNKIVDAIDLKNYLSELSDHFLEDYIKEAERTPFDKKSDQSTIDKSSQIIQPTSYLGNIAYFNSLKQISKLIIDIHDRFDKQTYRNRCTILTANGILNLTVPVTRPNGKNTLVKDVTINYEEDWQKDHVKAIESAYRSSPFYDFYADDLFRIIKTKHKYLVDLNIELTLFIAQSLGLKIDITKGNETDLADIPSKIALLPKERENFTKAPYQQVFLPPSEFKNNLSVIDLLFNCGKRY